MDEDLNKYNPNREQNGRFGQGAGGSAGPSGAGGGNAGGSGSSGSGQGGDGGNGGSDSGQDSGAEKPEEPVDVGDFEGYGRGGVVGPKTMTPVDVANDESPEWAESEQGSMAGAIMENDPSTFPMTEGWVDQDFANLEAMHNLDWATPEAVAIIETPSWEKSLNPKSAKNNPSLIVDVAEGKMMDKTAKWTEKEWNEFETIASETNKQRGDFVKIVSIAKAKETMAEIPSVKEEMEELEKSGVSQMLMGSYNNQTYLRAYKRN